MPRKLHVGNLSQAVQPDELERLFAGYGTVRSAAVTNQLRTADITGTAEVEMDSDANGEAAIAALNGTQHRGSALVVGWAEPGQRAGTDLPRMFESMNIPAEGEGQERFGPWREGLRGDAAALTSAPSSYQE